MATHASNPVGIIGAGTMGAGIAQAAASAGWFVKLFDIDPSLLDKARDNIAKRFDRLVEKNRITSERAEKCTSRISTTTSMDNLGGCDLIIEAATENQSIKEKIFKSMDSICKTDSISFIDGTSFSCISFTAHICIAVGKLSLLDCDALT